MSKAARSRGLDVNLRSGPQMEEYVAIADRIAAGGFGRVLDWGCGHGQISQLLLERGVDAVAYDYRPGTTETSVRLDHYPDIVAYVGGDPVALPFANGEFDTVLSCGVLEHVARPAESLTEIHRILRPAGRLLVYKLPNRRSYLEAIAKRLGLYYHGALPDDRVYVRGDASELLSRCGFHVDDVRLTNMLPLTLERPFAHRHAKAIWRLNVALGRVPGLELLATNVELDATRR